MLVKGERMKLLTSVQGIATIENPNQGLNDLTKAGFQNLYVDLYVDKDIKGRTIRSYELTFQKAKEKGLVIALARVPEFVEDGIRLCGEYGIEKVIIPSLENHVEGSKVFYSSLQPLAKKYGIKILLENQAKNINGHFVRGLFSNPEDVKIVLDELGRENFGFAFNMSNMNLCGQNPYEFLTALRGDVDAVLLSDNDGDRDARLLPFTSSSLKGCNVDWTNLVRGVRASGFDGDMVLEYADSAKAVSPFLKPGFLSYAKDLGDYFLWQFEMEKTIEKYPSRVLFGAGNMCRNYMLNYRKDYPPLYTCDNNSANWGKTFEGLEVKNPEELKSLPKDTAIFICNVYYREIEAQLKEMGITNPIERFNDEYLPQFPFERLPMATR